MDNLNDIIQLYGLDNLPNNVRKEKELRRWMEIMLQQRQRYEQDFLPNFLDEEAKARESNISYDAWFEHKKRMAMRWFGYYRKAKTVDKACEIGKQYNKIGMIIERGQQR